jgi:hypothetical protein
MELYSDDEALVQLNDEDGNDAIHLDGINIMGRERDE